MVVTEGVKAGTLLAVCNPLANAVVDPLDLGFQIDFMTRRVVRANYVLYTRSAVMQW